MEYTHQVKHFNDLSVRELYSIMRLRGEVFVVEQDCVFLDADNKDLFCYHLMLFDNKDLIGYARLVPAGISYVEMSIGRVVTSKKVRGTGAGRNIMKLAIEHCRKVYGDGPIRIGAQLYAEKFYNGLGFTSDSPVYDEDGIDHIEMIRYE
jgi:ElaA protein